MRTKRPLVFILAAIPITVIASPLVYQPINPSFGGHPSYGPVLMGQAQAQNSHEDPRSRDPFRDLSPLENFKEQLNRQVLSLISRQIVEAAFGENHGGGIFYTDDFSVEITTTQPGVVRVNVTDIKTGDVTVIEIPVFGQAF